jgi:hypothetical protein
MKNEQAYSLTIDQENAVAVSKNIAWLNRLTSDQWIQCEYITYHGQIYLHLGHLRVFITILVSFYSTTTIK